MDSIYKFIKTICRRKRLLLPKIERVLSSGKYILSEEVEKFEKEICNYQNMKFCISVNSGTDALILSLLSINIKSGDEVITQANSYVASAAAINAVGAKPVFCDVYNDQTMNVEDMESKINSKTKAIMPVHLTGRMCEMDRIMKIAKKNNLKVVEDCAQSIGSIFKGKKSGSYGELGAFSAHPLKNLNACGDAGFIVTNKKKLYNYIKLKRNHGHQSREKIKFFGTVSRLDSIQAVILNFRLKKLEKVISKRIRNALIYKKKLKNLDIYFPNDRLNSRDTFHLFVIQLKKRNNLKKFLFKNKIESNIHYPVPIHKQRPFSKILKTLNNTEKQSKEILSLPINQYLDKNDINKICSTIKNFLKVNTLMNLILSYEEILNKFNYDLINKLRKHGSEVNYLNLWVPDEDFLRSFESLVESIKASKISCFTLKVNKNILSNSLIKKFKKKFPNLLISEKENICLVYIKNTNSISFKKK